MRHPRQRGERETAPPGRPRRSRNLRMAALPPVVGHTWIGDLTLVMVPGPTSILMALRKLLSLAKANAALLGLGCALGMSCGVYVGNQYVFASNDDGLVAYQSKSRDAEYQLSCDLSRGPISALRKDFITVFTHAYQQPSDRVLYNGLIRAGRSFLESPFCPDKVDNCDEAGTADLIAMAIDNTNYRWLSQSREMIAELRRWKPINK